MATEYKKIVLRRGTGTPPTDLLEGELAYQTDTGKLFVGTGNASPNHYAEIVTTLAELGITATADELNILDGVTATTAELNILDGVTATAAELNILDGVTATAAELNFVDGVTSNIQTQIDNIAVNEWSLVQEINLTDVNSKVIDNTALGENYDNANYDYKFVIDAYTNATEGSIEPYFRFDQNSTAGKYSYITQITRVGGTGNTGSTTLLANSGATGDKIITALDLTTVPTQGSMTVLQLEAVVTRSMASSGGNFYGYNLKGSGSVVAAEGTEAVDSTYSLSAISQFTGGYGQAGANLTSVDILDLPNAGASDLAKIRVYKRAR